ncbi:hypothetical protein ABID56_001425 [Alkalibacillus flavidus]|uniref:NADH-quinone oxidoreductase subunit A n=1 Tax=Alkalibacillus flavidus TaxID=546021 RepID=A0ABV2KUS7_9BACI
MTDFLITYAPFLVLIGATGMAFWIALPGGKN